MKRRAILPAIVAALFMLLAVALAWFVPTVIEAVAKRRISALAGVPAELSLRHLGWDKAVVGPVAVGPDLSAERVVIEYDPAELVGGRLRAVRAEGLRLRLDFAGERPFPLLDRLREAKGGGGFLVDRITASGELALASSYRKEPVPFDLSADTAGEAMTLRLSLAGEGLSLAATIRRREGGWEIESDSGLSAELTALPPLLLEKLPAPLHAALAQPLSIRLGGLGDRPLRLTVAEREGGREFATSLAVDVAAGPATRLRAELIGAAVLGDDGALGRLDIGRLVVTATELPLPQGEFDAALRISELSGASRQAEGAAALNLLVRDFSAGEVHAREASLMLEGGLRLDDRNLAFVLRKPGALWIDGLTVQDAFAALAPLDLTLAPASEPLLAGGWGPEPWRLAAILAAFDLRGRIGGTEPVPLRLAAGGGRLAVTITGRAVERTNASVSDAALTLPGQGIVAEDLDMTFAGGGEAPSVTASAGRLAIGEDSPLVPLRAEARGVLVGDAIQFTGSLSDPPGRLRLDLAGRHDLGTGTGRAELNLPPVGLTPAGVQPADFVPGLARWLDDVSGTFAVDGTLRWTRDGLRPDLQVLLREISGLAGGVAFERLNTVLAIDGLAPLSTPPGQVLAVGLIQAGLPLTDNQAIFRIEDGRLVVEAARASLAGGTASIAGVVFEPGTRNRLTLLVDDVEVERLVALAGFESLSASGRLSGSLPLVVEPDGDVVFSGGALFSAVPGIIRYRPEEPPAALAGGGQSTEILLEALSNFHYGTLTTSIEGPVGGDLVAKLHIAGANPELYGGHPVELNLTLSGKLGRILEDALAGYQIPDTIRARLQEFGAR